MPSTLLGTTWNTQVNKKINEVPAIILQTIYYISGSGLSILHTLTHLAFKAFITTLFSRYYSYFSRAHFSSSPFSNLNPISARWHTQSRARVCRVSRNEWESGLGKRWQSTDTNRLQLDSLVAETETGIYQGNIFQGKPPGERVEWV